MGRHNKYRVYLRIITTYKSLLCSLQRSLEINLVTSTTIDNIDLSLLTRKKIWARLMTECTLSAVRENTCSQQLTSSSGQRQIRLSCSNVMKIKRHYIAKSMLTPLCVKHLIVEPWTLICCYNSLHFNMLDPGCWEMFQILFAVA